MYDNQNIKMISELFIFLSSVGRAARECFPWSIIAMILFIYCLCVGYFTKLIFPRNRQTALTSRVGYLDGLRAIAALLVVNAHFSGVIAWGLGNRKPLLFADNSGSMGVQIFFALSGFLFAEKIFNNKMEEPAKFLMGRIKRIFPLYFVAVTASILLMLVFSFSRPDILKMFHACLDFYLSGIFFTQAEKIGEFFPVQVLGTIWTLRYEWAFYLFVPFLAFSITSKRAMAASILAVLLYLVATTSVTATNIYWAFFLPGIFAAAVLRKSPILGAWQRYLVFVMIPVLSFLILFGPTGYTLFRLIEITILFLMIVLSEPRILFNKTLRFLGEISYSIYLVHFPMLFVAGQLLAHIYKSAFFSGWFQAVVEFLFAGTAILLSYGTYSVIESPFMAKSNKKSDRAFAVRLSSD